MDTPPGTAARHRVVAAAQDVLPDGACNMEQQR
jgi:hypothetical protein